MCLIARYLESIGIPALCLGSALDIFRSGQPPRAVFVDYPLGHSAGQAFDSADQLAIISDALRLFETLTPDNTVVELANQWPIDGWQRLAMNPAAGDTRAVRDTSPQWQCDSDRVLAEQQMANRAADKLSQ